MKRLHVHVAVADLEESRRFYATLFGAEPVVVHPDYAKWMLEDPRLNFVISARGRAPGLDHLGLQVDDAAELSEVASRLSSAGRPILEQKDTACCYARSDKAWVQDPAGLRWETFRTHGLLTTYGEDAAPPREPAPAAEPAAPRCGCSA